MFQRKPACLPQEKPLHEYEQWIHGLFCVQSRLPLCHLHICMLSDRLLLEFYYRWRECLTTNVWKLPNLHTWIMHMNRRERRISSSGQHFHLHNATILWAVFSLICRCGMPNRWKRPYCDLYFICIHLFIFEMGGYDAIQLKMSLTRCSLGLDVMKAQGSLRAHWGVLSRATLVKYLNAVYSPVK